MPTYYLLNHHEHALFLLSLFTRIHSLEHIRALLQKSSLFHASPSHGKRGHRNFKESKNLVSGSESKPSSPPRHRIIATLVTPNWFENSTRLGLGGKSVSLATGVPQRPTQQQTTFLPPFFSPHLTTLLLLLFSHHYQILFSSFQSFLNHRNK